ncbi:MAG: prepilin-type N-terminal cleavage/methylation domain-containing protein [Rhodoferax sp.]|nr:MAG: prepilin-type N-terminal cleavage/methylation domain-containing protein [Rhodoferax sp.]
MSATKWGSVPTVCQFVTAFCPPNGWSGRRRDYIETMKKVENYGFTLIELLVVMAVLAVIVSIATPSIQSTIAKAQVDSASENLVSDFRFARSQSLKLTNNISICSSVNSTSCTNSASWKDGWIVFVDNDADGVVDSGDQILRVQQQPRGVASIASGGSSDYRKFTFLPLGLARSATQTFFVISTNGVDKRLVCISNVGRPSLRAKEASSC